MRIGIVLPSVPGYSETFFTSKIKGLQAHGFEVMLFVNNYTKSASLNCQIIIAPKFSKNKIKNAFVSFFCLLKAVLFHYENTYNLYQLDKKDGLSFSKRIKRIVINSHLLTQKLDWLHFGFGTMALDRENVAKAIGAKMAVSFRGFDHYVYPVKNPNCYTILFKKEVKYHVLSEGMKKDLILKGIDEKQVVKITPAIDLSLFKTDKEKRQEENRMVTIARLHWIKGLEYILKALTLVKQKGINFEYYIIGDGVDEERLKFAVHQLNLQENVFFLGRLNPMEVKVELEKSSIYLQYSLQEGFCNAVLEAQAMGLICIVSDADGLSENVLNNKTGFVVPKRNPELLVEKIIQVLTISDTEKLNLIKHSIERIKTNFTIENQINQFIDFYK